VRRALSGFALGGALLLSTAAPAGEIPDAVVVLDVREKTRPGDVPEAAPARFVLMEDGTVFVGGSGVVWTGRLEKREARQLEKAVGRVRRMRGLPAQVSFGPGDTTYRLEIRKEREITASGDPAAAPASLRPLAALLAELAEFRHPSLRPFRPSAYALRAVEGSLPGGCRAWAFAAPLAQALGAPRAIAAEEIVGSWPVGAAPASVCHGEKRYVVTLRPLLPGERP
jgi:hypothetical protein